VDTPAVVVNYDHRSPRWLEALRDHIDAALWTVPGSLEAVTSGCGKLGLMASPKAGVKVPLPLTGPWQMVLVPRPCRCRIALHSRHDVIAKDTRRTYGRDH